MQYILHCLYICVCNISYIVCICKFPGKKGLCLVKVYKRKRRHMHVRWLTHWSYFDREFYLFIVFIYLPELHSKLGISNLWSVCWPIVLIYIFYFSQSCMLANKRWVCWTLTFLYQHCNQVMVKTDIKSLPLYSL